MAEVAQQTRVTRRPSGWAKAQGHPGYWQRLQRRLWMRAQPQAGWPVNQAVEAGAGAGEAPRCQVAVAGRGERRAAEMKAGAEEAVEAKAAALGVLRRVVEGAIVVAAAVAARMRQQQQQRCPLPSSSAYVGGAPAGDRPRAGVRARARARQQGWLWGQRLRWVWACQLSRERRRSPGREGRPLLRLPPQSAASDGGSEGRRRGERRRENLDETNDDRLCGSKKYAADRQQRARDMAMQQQGSGMRGALG